jgi:glycosyltransferase involved in cell wall biosynthesis
MRMWAQRVARGPNPDDGGHDHDSIVVFGGPPYQPSANQTSMQMLKELSSSIPVLYVARTDPRPLSTRRLSDLLRPVRKVGPGSPGLTQGEGNLAVLGLPAWCNWLPLVTPEPARRLQLFVIRLLLKRALREIGFERPALLVYWWMFPEIVRLRCWSWRVFDVIDRHWGYEYLNAGARSANWSLALRTARSSDRTVAVSDGLAQELTRELDSPVRVLPNGVDVRRVADAIQQAPPEGRRQYGRKRAAYVGGWNRRVDVELFVHVVRSLPDWQFTVIGVESVPEFSEFDNVRLIGDLSYDEVIVELSKSDIGLVPFRVNEYTKASSFLKVFDYLAAGMQVLSTPLPATEAAQIRFPGHVHVALAQDWVAMLERISSGDDVLALDLALLPSTAQRAISLMTQPQENVTRGRVS